MRTNHFTMILIIFIITMLLVSACTSISGNDEVASVNGEKITVGEYEFLLRGTKAQMEQEANLDNVESLWEMEIEGKNAIDVAKEKALEEAVINKIELQKAKEMGISLTADDKENIRQQKSSYMQAYGGRNEYLKELSRMGLNDNSFTKVLEGLYLTEKLYDKVTADDEVYNVTEEEKTKYYEDNKEEFKYPEEQLKAKHILISTQIDDAEEPADGEDEESEKSEEEREAALEEKKKSAREKAEDIYNRILAGEDFDKLMHEYSEDPGLQTNPDGYTFGKGQMVPEFEEAAYALEVGEVSEIVETQYGYHIIKLIDKIEYMPYEQIVNQLEDKVRRQKYNEIAIEQWKKDAEITKNEDILKRIKFPN